MKRTLPEKIALLIFAVGFIFATGNLSQTVEGQTKNVNFRYSQNPKTRTKPEANSNQTNNRTETVENVANQPPSIAAKTLEIAKKGNTTALSPTEIYKVGNGDILFINLQNAPKSSTYYTVLNDGTIDYALAGEMVSVAGLTTAEIEELLIEKIKLYENPQVSVKVREYASHTISVLGLVEKAGAKNIQREAVPLFVVRAEAIVSPNATRAVIRRADSNMETVDLKDSKSENILIFPGDMVEFVNSNLTNSVSVSQYYYIGGDVVSGGQKDFSSGISLTQAVLAAGGLKKSNAKRIVIRRKNANGLLVGYEYNLKNIKDGREPDPILAIGDTVEIGN